MGQNGMTADLTNRLAYRGVRTGQTKISRLVGGPVAA